MMFLTKKRRRKGFTLIELLVVIAIIGVLASIVLASLNTARRKSRDTRRVADMNQARLALQLYYDSNRVYPATGATLAPTYIALWPTDPVSGVAYPYIPLQGSAVGAGNATCTTTVGGTCQYFHTGAAVEEMTISAINSSANRCPITTGVCATEPPSTQLVETTIYGNRVNSNCTATAATGQGCYDVTP